MLELSQAISPVNVGLQSSPSTSTGSILMILIMEIYEKLLFTSSLTGDIFRKDFSTFIRRENFKS
jgi:hypothetical protein